MLSSPSVRWALPYRSQILEERKRLSEPTTQNEVKYMLGRILDTLKRDVRTVQDVELEKERTDLPSTISGKSGIGMKRMGLSRTCLFRGDCLEVYYITDP